MMFFPTPLVRKGFFNRIFKFILKINVIFNFYGQIKQKMEDLSLECYFCFLKKRLEARGRSEIF